ncbi:MAG: cyclic nucleotide-binding domain-containing protein [Pararobbsia sp.]
MARSTRARGCSRTSRCSRFSTTAEVEVLASRLSRHDYQPSQTVITADQVSNCLLIIASGVVTVTVDPSGGQHRGDKLEIARFGPGEAFGESGVLSGVPMAVDVTAMTRVVIYRLDKEDLSPLLKKRPELGQSMCRVLSRRRDYSRSFIHEETPAVQTESGLFQWLKDGMQRLHDLTL